MNNFEELYAFAVGNVNHSDVSFGLFVNVDGVEIQLNAGSFRQQHMLTHEEIEMFSCVDLFKLRLIIMCKQINRYLDGSND